MLFLGHPSDVFAATKMRTQSHTYKTHNVVVPLGTKISQNIPFCIPESGLSSEAVYDENLFTYISILCVISVLCNIQLIHLVDC